MSPLERARFSSVWRALGARDDRVFDELVIRYSAPGRHYHTAEHIVECLSWFDRVSDLAHDRSALEAAIWFHDAVHDPLAGDNEARSAALIHDAAREAGIETGRAEAIARLIAATDHRGLSSAGDEVLLVDIDLSILGAAPARYRRYEHDIRLEYAALPDDVFRRGRTGVLRGFLERTAIYRSTFFYDRLESQARENLAEAARALE